MERALQESMKTAGEKRSGSPVPRRSKRRTHGAEASRHTSLHSEDEIDEEDGHEDGDIEDHGRPKHGCRGFVLLKSNRLPFTQEDLDGPHRGHVCLHIDRGKSWDEKSCTCISGHSSKTCSITLGIITGASMQLRCRLEVQRIAYFSSTAGLVGVLKSSREP